MDIKAISTISLPAVATAAQNTNTPKPQEAQNVPNKTEKKHSSKLPYVAGTIVLAGLGAYLGRNQIAKLFKEKEVIKKEIEKEIVKEVKKELKYPPYTPEFLNAKNASKKPVFKLPKKEQPVVSKSPVVMEQPAPISDAYQSVRSKLNVDNKEILAKILDNKKSQASEINRIIGENIQNEHVNLPIMQKVARDFAMDNAGRGENRFHQAADIMEQSLIKEFVKGDAKQKTGLQSFFDVAKGDSPLFEIYAHMPIDEAATRLRYLADNDLKSASYKGMDVEAFFEKSMHRLVEKLQFKKYNEAHNIKSAF